MLSVSLAEDLAFAGYLGIIVVNLLYIVNSIMNPSIDVVLSLILAGKDPKLYLAGVAIACSTVWLEIVPHPTSERMARSRLLSRNMSIVSLVVLIIWSLPPMFIGGGGLGVTVRLIREARFVPLLALTLLLAGLLPQGPSQLLHVVRGVKPLFLIAISPLVVYVVWRAEVLGPYISIAAVLILLFAWAIIIYDIRERGV